MSELLGLTISEMIQDWKCKPISDYNLTDLLGAYGSQRRLLEAYWKGSLTPAHEKQVEDNLPPERIIGMKPLA